MSNVKYRAITIAAVILICIYGIIGLPTSMQELSDNLKKSVRLGLDLKGGSQLMLEVQLQDAFKAEADNVILRLKESMSKASIIYVEMTRTDPQSLKEADSVQISIKGVPATKAGDFRTLFNDNFSSSWILTPIGPTDYRLTMQQSYALKLKADTLTQSINTIDKKINGLGLSESTVQKRGGCAGCTTTSAGRDGALPLGLAVLLGLLLRARRAPHPRRAPALRRGEVADRPARR